jgi:hypothetical protein
MVAFCWLFQYDLYHDARNHEHQTKNKFSNLNYLFREIGTGLTTVESLNCGGSSVLKLIQ